MLIFFAFKQVHMQGVQNKIHKPKYLGILHNGRIRCGQHIYIHKNIQIRQELV